VSQIDKVKKEHGTRLAMVPMLPTEPVGIPALEALSRTRVALTRWGPAMRAEGDPVDDPLSRRQTVDKMRPHIAQLSASVRQGFAGDQPWRESNVSSSASAIDDPDPSAGGV
jgi:hypothetical protein